jgi:hypothetical protein
MDRGILRRRELSRGRHEEYIQLLASPSALRHCHSGFRSGRTIKSDGPDTQNGPSHTGHLVNHISPSYASAGNASQNLRHLLAWDVTAPYRVDDYTRPSRQLRDLRPYAAPAGRAKTGHRKLVGVGGTIS